MRWLQRAVLAALVPSYERGRQRHELALLLGGRCGACAELMPDGEPFSGSPCPSCGEGTILEPDARTLVAHYIQSRIRKRVLWLAVAVGVAQLFVGWLPIVSSLVLALATASIRFHIVEPASKLLGRRRRGVTTWSARLATAVVIAASVILYELLTLLFIVGPVAKSLLSAGEVVFVAWASARYMHVQIDRENRGLPVASEEYAFLGGAAFMLLAGATLVIVSIAWALEAIRSLMSYLI